jgi:hypothetical protein
MTPTVLESLKSNKQGGTVTDNYDMVSKYLEWACLRIKLRKRRYRMTKPP